MKDGKLEKKKGRMGRENEGKGGFLDGVSMEGKELKMGRAGIEGGRERWESEGYGRRWWKGCGRKVEEDGKDRKEWRRGREGRKNGKRK